MKLETGYNDHFLVRRVQCVAAVPASFSVLYISDLHFTSHSGGMVEKMLACIEQLDPSVILLGGDYADTKKGFQQLDCLLRSLSSRENIFAIAGNHDHYFGIQAIQQLMVNNGVNWLEKKSTVITLNNSRIQLDGNVFSGEKSDADISVLFLHKPLKLEQQQHKYQLAFAGHLHGCQFVLWQHNGALYPGRFFYPLNILEQKMEHCHYLISRGMGDTLPIRFNCSKEMIFVTINSNKI